MLLVLLIDVVNCSPKVVNVGMIGATTLQALSEAAESDMLWSELLKCTSAYLYSGVFFLELHITIPQSDLHYPHRYSMIHSQMVLDFTGHVFIGKLSWYFVTVIELKDLSHSFCWRFLGLHGNCFVVIYELVNVFFRGFHKRGPAKLTVEFASFLPTTCSLNHIWEYKLTCTVWNFVPLFRYGAGEIKKWILTLNSICHCLSW